METFRKYGFTTPALWQSAKAEISTTDEEGNQQYNDSVTAVVELGNLCETWGTDEEGNPICEVVSSIYSVDVLWKNEPNSSKVWANALLWVEPVGIHTFGPKHAAEYAKAYCEANPEAEYCNPPEEVEENV